MSPLSINEMLFPSTKEGRTAGRPKPRNVDDSGPSVPLWGELKLVAAEDPRFSTRERVALNNALQSAWDSKDPVRWILVRARVELLGLTARGYAAEIGMASHSLITKEQKGGEKTAPSSFSLFLKDWQQRSVSDAQHGRQFSRASKLLMHSLLGERYFGIPGLVTRWQCRVGAAEFERRTHLDPKLLSNYRTHGFNPHFAELLDIARRAHLLGETKDSSLWRHPTVVEARREFLHESLRRGRSLSTTLLRCALELTGERPTDENMKRSYPFLKEQERKMVLRYDRLPVSLFEVLIQSIVERGHLSSVEGDRLINICTTENRRSPSASGDQSVKAIERRQRSEGLENATLAAYFGGIVRSDSGDLLEHLRRAVQRVDESSRAIPFGVVAYVLAESPNELKKILRVRRKELHVNNLKRFGTVIADESLERKIWGLSDADIRGSGGDVHAAVLQRVMTLGVPVKQKLMRRFVVAPREFVGAALEMFPSSTLGHRAKSSAEMLGRIASGDVYPNRALYKRIVEASCATLSLALDLLWYDGYASQYQTPKGKTDFGAMQCKIIDSLIAARGENRRELLLRHSTPLQAQSGARELLRLERTSALPIVIFYQVLGYLGVARDSAEGSVIAALLSAKSYPVAIASWFRDGAKGASPELREAAHRILEGPGESVKDRIAQLPTDPVELLELRARWSNSANAADKTEAERLMEDSCQLLRTIPGASISDLEQARRVLRKSAALEPAIEFSWSRCPQIPVKEGGLYIEPTTATGARISRETAAIVANAIHCPQELLEVLERDSLVILRQLDLVEISDPWSGAILQPERGVSPEDVRNISEVLLPRLLPALSLKTGLAENLLRWQKALWSHQAGAEAVVHELRARRVELAKSTGQLPSAVHTPMAIIDAAILVASEYRKKRRQRAG